MFEGSELPHEKGHIYIIIFHLCYLNPVPIAIPILIPHLFQPSHLRNVTISPFIPSSPSSFHHPSIPSSSIQSSLYPKEPNPIPYNCNLKVATSNGLRLISTFPPTITNSSSSSSNRFVFHTFFTANVVSIVPLLRPPRLS